MWVRDSGATLSKNVVDRWNETHPDNQIEATILPAEEMVTKAGTAIAAGEGPDILALDLIFMPDFMRAGFVVDITDQMKDDPNVGRVSPAHVRLATYEDRLFGVPFTPDNSVLVYNKDLFRQAGLDPEKPPTTTQELVDYARAIGNLGPDIYGLYMAGNCAACQGFTMWPQMWATPGVEFLPDSCEADSLVGDSIATVLEAHRTMWTEGLIPPGAQTDNGANFASTFTSGKIGMQGTGNFHIAILKNDFPNLDFGIGFLPGVNPGEASSFAGGDVLAIPRTSKHPDEALEFLKWVLTDDPQLEVFARTGNLPSRSDLAHNAYFAADARLSTTAEALAIAQTPYTFKFNDMVRGNSPWLAMSQTAIFDGDVAGAIAQAREDFHRIQCE
jgi:multiple sugar transport system substrate-binding protein